MALTVQSAADKDRRTAKHGVTLQHRHFAFIANVIADIPDTAQRATMAIRFASECQRTNRNFDWDRFIIACGVDQ